MVPTLNLDLTQHNAMMKKSRSNNNNADFEDFDPHKTWKDSNQQTNESSNCHYETPEIPKSTSMMSTDKTKSAEPLFYAPIDSARGQGPAHNASVSSTTFPMRGGGKSTSRSPPASTLPEGASSQGSQLNRYEVSPPYLSSFHAGPIGYAKHGFCAGRYDVGNPPAATTGYSRQNRNWDDMGSSQGQESFINKPSQQAVLSQSTGHIGANVMSPLHTPTMNPPYAPPVPGLQYLSRQSECGPGGYRDYYPNSHSPPRGDQRANITDRKIFVGGLHYSTTDQELKNFFEERFGSVVEAHTVKNREGQSRGFGFVIFHEPESRFRAVAADHVECYGARVDIRAATPPNSTPIPHRATSSWNRSAYDERALDYRSDIGYHNRGGGFLPPFVQSHKSVFYAPSPVNYPANYPSDLARSQQGAISSAYRRISPVLYPREFEPVDVMPIQPISVTPKDRTPCEEFQFVDDEG